VQRALITGASSGIGRSFAETLAAEGYAVTLIARSEGRLNELAKRLPGKEHRVLVADLAAESEVERVCLELEHTPYDLLINNAGVGLYGPFADSDWETLKQLHRLNTEALLALSFRYLRTAKAGNALINVASVLGCLPFPHGGALYAASKAFVVSLSQALWEEQRKRGVYVMALCPGITETNFYAAAGGDPAKPPPRAMTQTASEVVSETLAALSRRKLPVVVTGRTNRLLLFIMRFVSRRATAKIMAKAKPHRRPTP
jgi:short-subunit dehydrogenase